VLWHGMGDTCCNQESIGKIREFIQTSLPGIYVHSIMIGDDENEDKKAGFFGNVNQQVSEVCEKLKNDENLRDGFNAIGFSQHAGVSELPNCDKGDGFCRLMNTMASRGVYSEFVRKRVIQAQYFKDPKNIETYLAKNIFLPDINNELMFKNKTYAKNLASLNKFVMIRFTEDTIVRPKDSSWFSFYDEEGNLIPLQEQKIYKEDWIGLKELNNSGKLIFKDCETSHVTYIYVGIKEYPKWRRDKRYLLTRNIEKIGNKENKKQEAMTKLNQQTKQNPLIFIPLIPFALIYFTLRITWDLFKLFVFYSLESVVIGSILLKDILFWSIKEIPVIILIILRFWKDWIQVPLLRLLNIIHYWSYNYAWPIIKKLIILNWKISTRMFKYGKEVISYSFNKSLEISKKSWENFGYPISKFLLNLILYLIIKPGTWIISRSIYLSRILWICSCFLARDLAEDVRDLWITSYNIFNLIWNYGIQPTCQFFIRIVKLTIQMTKSIIQMVKSIKQWIINTTIMLENYLPIIERFLYMRLILTSINNMVNIIHGICSNKIFRFLVGNFFDILIFTGKTLMEFINYYFNQLKEQYQKIKLILITYIVKSIKRASYEIIEITIISCFEIMKSLVWIYHSIIRPTILALPMAKKITSSIYRNGYEYFQLFLSFTYNNLISLCNIILPYLYMMISQIEDKTLGLLKRLSDTLINNYLPRLSNFIYELQILQSLQNIYLTFYVKFEPIILEWKQKIVETADSMVVNLGQSMMEWVKKEQELKSGTSG
ncbi:8605_t:CDS:2, partial [Diversispora eburnea]